MACFVVVFFFGFSIGRCTQKADPVIAPQFATVVRIGDAIHVIIPTNSIPTWKP